MEFKTQAQKETYERILPWMKELFGMQFMKVVNEAPLFVVDVGSVLVHVSVEPWEESSAVVRAVCWLVSKVELTPELMLYLLQESYTMRFGSFTVDQDKDIFFEHAIVGPTCDIEELKATVLSVVSTSDRYDDTITKRWGGQTALDRVRSS